MFNHEHGIILKVVIIALLVGFAKIASRHGLPHAEMVELAGVSLGRDNEVSEAFPIGQLSEHHRK